MSSIIPRFFTESLKGCLDCDSFATFLRLFSDADAQVRKRWDSFCVDSSYPAVSGSKSRLADSLETLGGLTLNSNTVDTTLHRERLSPYPAPSYQETRFSYCWKNGYSYSMCFINYCLRTLSLYFTIFLTYRAAYLLAISIFYELSHFQVDFTQTKLNFTLAKFNSAQAKFNFIKGKIQYHIFENQFQIFMK